MEGEMARERQRLKCEAIHLNPGRNLLSGLRAHYGDSAHHLLRTFARPSSMILFFNGVWDNHATGPVLSNQWYQEAVLSSEA
jgi:hypothetical protein